MRTCSGAFCQKCCDPPAATTRIRSSEPLLPPGLRLLLVRWFAQFQFHVLRHGRADRGHDARNLDGFEALRGYFNRVGSDNWKRGEAVTCRGRMSWSSVCRRWPSSSALLAHPKLRLLVDLYRPVTSPVPCAQTVPAKRPELRRPAGSESRCSTKCIRPFTVS